MSNREHSSIIEQHRQAKCRDDNEEQYGCGGREAYFVQSCNEIQEHADFDEMSVVYKKICQIARNFKPRTREIMKDDGTVLWDFKGILNNWKAYYNSRTPVINKLVSMVEVTAEDLT